MKHVLPILPLLLLLSLLAPTTSIYFQLDKTFCFNSQQIAGETYHLYIESTSQQSQEPTVHLSIIDSHSTSILQQSLTHKNIELNGTYELHICLTNPHSYILYIMLDFWSSHANKIKELASKGQIYELHNEMYYLSEGIRNISKGEKMQEGRQNLHSSIILGYEGKIKWLGVMKVMLIVGLAFVEILVLKFTLQKEDNKFEMGA